ncbi:AsmA family protein [Motiliproteus sp. MSK22-1]|uniref:AsmA family protein n=1 Tax=Motiliproteus sp. MSK22-1 TaxID=1897630 RepID=UPI000975BFD6|nr:AsmA family protein [Motiliproteus sp. MSK22-1]OMH28100.1 hypothetical protein BGP75_22300 [Motiliproteus sp. MSK22-1]
MKGLLKVIGGLVVILVVTIVAAGLLLDPNDYKEEIETLAREKASVELTIGGDIGWSLFPTLGLELAQVDAKSLDGKPLASLNKAQVSVKLSALLQGQVLMDGVLIDGLQLAIVASEESAEASGQNNDAGGESTQALHIDIGKVDIRNANISYEDPKTGQKFVLTDFNFSGENVVTQQDFPAAMEFNLAVYKGSDVPSMSIDAELRTQIFVDTVNNLFKATELDLAVDLKGDAFGDKTVPISLQADLLADIAADRTEVKGLSLNLADLALTADIDIQQMSAKPKLTGKLQVAAFDLKQLLAALGQEVINTSDSDALKKLALSTQLSGPANSLGLKELDLQLDDTRFKGEISYDLATGAQQLILQGDQINLDRYLPPADQQVEPEVQSETSAERYPKTPLLPLDTLKAFNLDVDFGLSQLQVSGLKLSDLKLQVNAKNGLVKVSKVAGKLYEGSFDNSAVIDARKQPLKLSVHKQISQVQLGGIMKDLAEKDTFSGVFNMKGDYQSSGNSIYDIVHSLDGKLDFSVKDGRLNGVNLIDKLCSGILQLQGKTPDTQAADSYTEFSNLSGTVNMDKGVLVNPDLKAALIGVNLGGNGQVDLPEEALDYGLSLTVLQELKGPNCQIDNKLHNLSLPLRCTGGFDDQPADMCGLDKEGMKQVLADLGAEEIKAKAKEKVEAKKEAIKEKVDAKVKDKLKNLFD